MGLNPGRPFDPALKPCAAYGPICHDASSPSPISNRSFPPLGPGREVDAVVEGIAEIDVQADVVLPVGAGVERGGARRPQRGVDGVVDGEVGGARADVGARVPQQAPRELAAHARDHRRVEHVAPEPRGEAAGKALLEREAAGVGETRARAAGSGRAAVTGTGGQPAVPSGTPSPASSTSPTSRLRPPSALNTADGVLGFRKKEAALHRAAGVVGVAVGLRAVREQVAEVAPQLQVVVDARRPPELGGVGDRVVAGRDQGRVVVPLHAAVGGAAVAVPPVCSSRLPPDRSSFSRKFITPAIASEPYCAAAPSRSTSTCRSAIDGMLEMSGPCDPSATPLPIHVMTAPRWRRFPFTSTSVWSGARPRRVAGRISRAPSPTGCGLTL